MAQIRHIAILAADPEKLAQFYQDVFGMQIKGKSQGGVWMTDGHIDFALLPYRGLEGKYAQGLHHFGFTLEANEKDKVYRKLDALGIVRKKPDTGDGPKRPYAEEQIRDPENNWIDCAQSAVAGDGSGGVEPKK